MKLKSLILGSVAAAGLSTAGFAADLGVLTALDVCDELGLSGLTISSDTNCLQISGKVSYNFEFGDYRGTDSVAGLATAGAGIVHDIDAPNGIAPLQNDWRSRVESLLRVVGTASSDFGPARAVLLLRQRDYDRWDNSVNVGDPDAHGLRFQEAYVQIGDVTVISAGRKGSIFNKGDDEPFNFTGLFAAEKEDAGVIASDELITSPWGLSVEGIPETGGKVIQLEHAFGQGLVGKVGLERLGDKGTLVGVLDYSGAGISAHISGAYGGLFTGNPLDSSYMVHAGVTGSFDRFRLRAAGSAGATAIAGNSFYNGLLSAEGTFDMFTIAVSGEVLNVETGFIPSTGWGFGGSIGFAVTEGIRLNLGGRYFGADLPTVHGDGYHVAAQIVAALTESVTLTGELGVKGRGAGIPPAMDDFYGSAELGWQPGGGFESAIGATVQQNGAYKVTFNASKEFN